MKTSTILCAVLAGIGFSSVAVAQPGRPADAFYDELGRPRTDWQAGNQAHGRTGADGNDSAQRNFEHRAYGAPRPPSTYQPNYSARQHGYQRGSYLPREYRQQRYYVTNWRAYPGLYAPPRGHQWVQVGSDFALMSTANGRIVNLLGNG